MPDEEKVSTPSKASAGGNSSNPESPTTARPLDFDDEPQETGVTSIPTLSTSTQPITGAVPPPKPPRPLSPQQQAENTLREAFPTIDVPVVKAVLVASSYNVERAFHALLGMTDPSAQEELPPPKPPRPTHPPTSTTRRQLEEDEIYARQLAEHYGDGANHGSTGRSTGQARQPQNNFDADREHSFFDDDLPVIRENIRKGFLETQSKVNTWVQNFKKKLDGEDEEPRPSEGYTHGYAESQTYNRPRRSADLSRRSGDRERYDADPQLLGDDFSALELRDSEAPPPRPSRPTTNPNLFRTSSPSPDRRKVSFQGGPPEEIDGFYDVTEPIKRTSSAGNKFSKWQPLSSVDPSPIVDNDPFSLGDSEDERDAKSKDANSDEADRIKKATGDGITTESGSGSMDGNKPKDNTTGK